MLIDINAYVGHWPFMQLKHNTCETLLQRMNQFGVDISVVSNLNGIFYKNMQNANEELYHEIKSHKKYSNRLFPFAIINPVYGAWKQDFKTCIEKMGMKGVRLYPHYHDYDITEPPVIELVKMARDYDVPVAFPIRMVDSRQRFWMDLKKEWLFKEFIPIVNAVPDAKYIFMNISTGIGLNNNEIQILKKSDFLIDTSGRHLQYMNQVFKIFGKERFIFGTHAPILDYLTSRLRIDTLRADEASETDKNLIRSGNAKRFLKL
ncbi:MAG: amidohydrolase family protein [Niabella sp.]